MQKSWSAQQTSARRSGSWDTPRLWSLDTTETRKRGELRDDRVPQSHFYHRAVSSAVESPLLAQTGPRWMSVMCLLSVEKRTLSIVQLAGLRVPVPTAGRCVVYKALLLAEVRAAIARIVCGEHALLRHDQPGAAIPRPPLSLIVDNCPRWPTIGVVAATGAGVQWRVPVLVDVMHLQVDIAVLTALREGRSRERKKPCSRERPDKTALDQHLNGTPCEGCRIARRVPMGRQLAVGDTMSNARRRVCRQMPGCWRQNQVECGSPRCFETRKHGAGHR